jgi:tRNA 2-thiouridine synthesizing protein E
MVIERKAQPITQIVDGEGFLLQPDIWDKEVALDLSRGEVYGSLTPDHWKVIDCVRQYHRRFGTGPSDRLVARSIGFSVPCIRPLFPNGYAKGVCKVAGIPRQALKVGATVPTHRIK